MCCGLLCLPSKAGGPPWIQVNNWICSKRVMCLSLKLTWSGGGWFSMRPEEHRWSVRFNCNVTQNEYIHKYKFITISPLVKCCYATKNLPSRKIKIFRATFLWRKAQIAKFILTSLQNDGCIWIVWMIIQLFLLFFNRFNSSFYIFVFASAHFLAVAFMVVKTTDFLFSA